MVFARNPHNSQKRKYQSDRLVCSHCVNAAIKPYLKHYASGNMHFFQKNLLIVVYPLRRRDSHPFYLVLLQLTSIFLLDIFLTLLRNFTISHMS